MNYPRALVPLALCLLLTACTGVDWHLIRCVNAQPEH